ncbi:MAG: Mrp/NBP35 family ATP-binding protein [Phycisphaeraceae bacterium]|nr:Mrp/NBP35 family ATP-binding protein [Phycisphaeraceae bacterium]
MDKNSVQQALAGVPHPVAGTGLVAAGAVAKVAYCDGYASVRLNGGGLNAAQRKSVENAARAAVLRAAGPETLREVHIEVTEDAPDAPLPEPKAAAPTGALPGAPSTSGPVRARHIIAVGAGKGGVGKSSIAVNLAIGLARKGHAVGLMDGDIYGPSLPTMLGLGAIDAAVRGRMIEPFLVHNLKAMTIGALVDPDKPLVWRGPMAHGAFKQLVEQTNWGELDYLIIDLPPGTGDVALTMAQMLKLTGAVVVCTPQKVAQDDAIRAAKMFQQLGIEVLGVVENMSWFVGDDGKEYDIFGRGGAQRMAQRLGVPFLGAVPITMALRENSDSGNPTANFIDPSPAGRRLAAHLETMVTSIENQASLAAVRQGHARPTLTIS